MLKIKRQISKVQPCVIRWRQWHIFEEQWASMLNETISTCTTVSIKAFWSISGLLGTEESMLLLRNEINEYRVPWFLINVLSFFCRLKLLCGVFDTQSPSVGSLKDSIRVLRAWNWCWTACQWSCWVSADSSRDTAAHHNKYHLKDLQVFPHGAPASSRHGIQVRGNISTFLCNNSQLFRCESNSSSYFNCSFV